VIYDSSPDLPGEFAGGVIEINTKSTPEKTFNPVSVGAGYNILRRTTKIPSIIEQFAILFSKFSNFIALQNLRLNLVYNK
jgi:hypothetical protein